MLLPSPIHRLQLRLATSWRQRTVTLKAASFALVGVVNTIVDFGVFLLALALPLALLTILLYWVFCLIGRGARRLSRGQPEEE